METIIVLDFGGQYCHLISRRIRDAGVFSEVLPNDVSVDELKKIKGLKGIVLSGGAASVYDKDSPKCDKEILNIGIPILGICYGHQLISFLEKGKVKSGESGEYGLTEMNLNVTSKSESELVKGLKQKQMVWMNHRDIVEALPAGYIVVASTKHSPVAIFENKKNKIFGVQFHPEVTHTENGQKLIENFVFNICKAKKEWDVSNYAEQIKKEIKKELGNKRAIIGLSGGIDSSTAAVLISQVIGDNLVAVYVDTGLMRYKETEFIRQAFESFDFKLRIVDAGKQFFKALKGITEPEEKRKIIGKTFIDVFEKAAKEENAEFLIQGTIYSDRIESGITKHSATIKSHHNVGGLPKDMKLKVYEPLRDLYKDEVRKLAKQLGIPDELVNRHVFPGPGLGVRILGEVTPEKADIVRRASHIIEEELKKQGWYDKVWMAFGVLLPIKSVGVQGDERSYKFPLVVRIVESQDAMTATYVKMPHKVLEIISTRITNEIKEINRVVYDITNKPPATMEWE
ncbi:MAG: glutamine-hydrolyzing GMP synthase [Nanoarchaeota archaeon]|nr:glutamine-hydrolyzing GMP synthase [Nanoarchaeota archaeon]MBU1321733.1 glutamine-hydrolyzing GMP synthase [Nanoarchaeota archaeon]MBU1597699.1 glutamine-hydrolyzing GMP synthase [Nanoarchaeota archaeon]MBU2440739.1 glutamine-hydrolyzing GMP synthase [Nanoarchaeota archaeon]